MSAALGLLPIAVAASWVPVRSDLSNIDIALLLVLCVGLVAIAGGRWAAVVGAASASGAFDFFDTAPYGQLFITRGRDIATTLLLAAASLLVGELGVRARAYRQIASSRGKDFTVMSGAARLMSGGEDPSMVVGALAGELVSCVGAEDCEFQSGPPTGERPFVTRDGNLISFHRPLPGATSVEIDLPVWVGAAIVGRYRLRLASSSPPSPDRLQAAVGIAEQAGAALAPGLAAPPLPPRPRRHQLRLLR